MAKEAEREKIEMTQKMKEKDLKEEKLAKYNRELNTIKEGIMMADCAIEEANTELVGWPVILLLKRVLLKRINMI